MGFKISVREALAYGLVTQVFIFSFILHSPWTIPKLYTDILGFFWEDFAERGLIPYVGGSSEEIFEYPFLSGGLSILWYILGRDLTGFYILYSITVFISLIIIAYIFLKTSRNDIGLICLTSPSIVLFSIYGYDSILAMFTALSLYMFIKGRYTLSSIFLALGFHTKFLSILLLPYILMNLKKRDALRYLAIFTVATITPIIFFPKPFFEIVKYHMLWPLENAWYIYIFPDAAMPLLTLKEETPSIGAAKLFGYILMLLLYIYILRREIEPRTFSTLSIMVYLLSTPRYSPQTSILLTPFLAMVMTQSMFPAFILWEAGNILIILTWFTTDAPHMPWQPPQVASLIRFIGLLTLFIQILYREGLLRFKGFDKLLQILAKRNEAVKV